MNILIHTAASPYENLPIGGAETSLRLIAELLALRGHKVYFISKSKKISFKAVTMKVINGVDVILFHKYPNPLKIYKLDYLAGKRKKKYLEKLLINKEIEIVYTYYNLSLCKRYLKLKQSPEYNFKLVVRIAGMRWYEQIKVNESFKEVYHNLFEQADSLNFISEGLLLLYSDGLKELNMTSKSKHHFVKDIGVVEISEKRKGIAENAEETLNCVMVSRFSKYQKRQDILVEAVYLLNEEIPIHLTFVGEGPTKDILEKKVRKLGISEKITFLPFLNQEALWKTISQQNLVCHACNYEGLSKIIIESMAMGMPVLASDVLPLNLYIIDGKNGFLVANTAAEWAKKIETLYRQRRLFEKIGTAASVFIKANYDASINVLEYEKQFENLIKL